MTALRIDHVYQYPQASRFNLESREMRLSTSRDEVGAYPHIFEGIFVHPQRTAKILLVLMSIVQGRFHVPTAMLGRIIALADRSACRLACHHRGSPESSPVVTGRTAGEHAAPS